MGEDLARVSADALAECGGTGPRAMADGDGDGDEVATSRNAPKAALPDGLTCASCSDVLDAEPRDCPSLCEGVCRCVKEERARLREVERG